MGEKLHVPLEYPVGVLSVLRGVRTTPGSHRHRRERRTQTRQEASRRCVWQAKREIIAAAPVHRRGLKTRLHVACWPSQRQGLTRCTEHVAQTLLTETLSRARSPNRSKLEFCALGLQPVCKARRSAAGLRGLIWTSRGYLTCTRTHGRFSTLLRSSHVRARCDSKKLLVHFYSDTSRCECLQG